LKKMQRKTDGIFAYGEVTGHCHAVDQELTNLADLDMSVDENGDIFVMSKGDPINIKHDEHGTITLPPNEWFNVSRQREYDPVAEIKERQVAD